MRYKKTKLRLGIAAKHEGFLLLASIIHLHGIYMMISFTVLVKETGHIAKRTFLESSCYRYHLSALGF